jgi:hypothetical protein
MRKEKNKKPSLYNRAERNAKVLSLIIEYTNSGLPALPNNIIQKCNKWVETGEEITCFYPIPQYTHDLVIKLVNDKRQQSHFCLKFREDPSTENIEI